MPFLEHVAYQTAVFSQEYSPAVTSHYAGGVLAPVLYDSKGIVNKLIDPLVRDDPDNAAHSLFVSSFD
jgi:hypothetical protein